MTSDPDDLHTHTLHLKKMFWLFALPLLTSYVQLTRADNGGAKVQVTKKGLEYGKELGLEMLKSVIKKAAIQDLQGSYKSMLTGTIDYSLSGIKVLQVQVSSSKADFSARKGINLTIENAQISLTGKWKLSHKLGKGNGDINTTIRQLSISTLLGVGKQVKGQLSVKVIECKTSVGGLALKLQGKNSWFYNSLVPAFKKTLKSEINKSTATNQASPFTRPRYSGAELCPLIEEGIDNIAEILKVAGVTAPIDSFVGIDFTLMSEPVIGVDQCTGEFKGEFYPLGKPSRAPLQPAPFSLPKQSNSMVVLGVSEFVLNTAAFAYFTAGVLRVKLTNDTIPKGFLFRMNTKNIGNYSQELYEQFPHMLMEVHIAARKAPHLSMKPDGLNATLAGSAEAFVILPNASLVPVFLLNFDSNLRGQISFEAVKSGKSIGKVGGSVTLENIQLSQEWSKVGDIKIKSMEDNLKEDGQRVLSKLNNRLKEGIPLPYVPKTTLQNPKVTMHEGYMVATTDMHYKP
ncbi:bactericidal permeability-increasing protein-like [Elgaria multicarinata webbii]|uniref:bactericidal permeability-increasing protein-like n=1 Tax=Elgaria multicarinata webbii TaxID=159646 RepID=UPI002FCCE4BC